MMEIVRQANPDEARANQNAQIYLKRALPYINNKLCLSYLGKISEMKQNFKLNSKKIYQRLYFIAKQVFTISSFLAIGWVVKELIVEQP